MVDQYLEQKGVSEVHRDGIIANIKAESNFDPGAVGDSGQSYGLFQHHKERRDAMVGHTGPNWSQNWQAQVDYALSEAPGKRFLRTHFPSSKAATAWWTLYFENPKDAKRKSRERAKYIPERGA